MCIEYAKRFVIVIPKVRKTLIAEVLRRYLTEIKVM